MDSLITIGEYFGNANQEAYKTEAQNNDHSPALQEKDPSPKGTIGTIASEVQLHDRKQDIQIEQADKVNMFTGVIGEDAEELTSLEEAEFSVHDASLIQLERDMHGIDKSRKYMV